jgi:hypothetical protein
MDLGKMLQALVERGTLLRRIVWVVLIGLVIADILVPSKYDRFPWESIGGFGAFYGFISCVLIIVVSKALGYLALYRNEEYYGEAEAGTEPGHDGAAVGGRGTREARDD